MNTRTIVIILMLIIVILVGIFVLSVEHSWTLYEDNVSGRVPSPAQSGTPIVEEPYQLESDPHEQKNLIADMPDIAARMRDLVTSYQESCRDAQSGSNITWKLTDEDEEGLSALGYIE